MAEQMYYVQDTRQMVGNCMLWWCPNGQGYTTQIDHAGLYGASAVKGMRESDVGWPQEFIERHVCKHVRRDNIAQADTVETIRGK